MPGASPMGATRVATAEGPTKNCLRSSPQWLSLAPARMRGSDAGSRVPSGLPPAWRRGTRAHFESDMRHTSDLIRQHRNSNPNSFVQIP